MPRLSAFNNMSLDGYFTGADGDLSWAKGFADPEFAAFTAENAKGNARLLFGRKTYEMMAGYWPTPTAIENNPVVAEGMNRMPKFVASRTLKNPEWSNTTVLAGDLLEAVRALKTEPGEDIAVLGSGSIVAQLAEAGLLDELQVVVNPIALGRGRSMFETIGRRLSLHLTRTRAFGNGNVFLAYRPTASA